MSSPAIPHPSAGDSSLRPSGRPSHSGQLAPPGDGGSSIAGNAKQLDSPATGDVPSLAVEVAAPQPAELPPQDIGSMAGLLGENELTVVTKRNPRGEPLQEGLLQASGSDDAQWYGAPELLPGQYLDQFEILELVGQGGMGCVYRARDERLQREVAIKLLHQEVAQDVDLAARFRQEAQSAARLHHPHIATVYHFGQTGDWQYLVFEFVSGLNLRELVRQAGPLAWQDSIRIMREATSALDHAFRRGVVHRDIKPSNLILTEQNGIKLVDLGLARLSDRPTHDLELTASGMTLGTYDYISPEQARDPRTADVRSDLYSLGCTWYFLLTSIPPYPDGGPVQKLIQHQTDPIPDPRVFHGDIPEEVARMVARLMAKSTEDRYQRPVELSRDLDAVAFRHGLEDFVQPLPRRREVARPWRPWPLLSALVPFLLLIAGLWLSDRRFQTQATPDTGVLAAPPTPPFTPSGGPKPGGIGEKPPLRSGTPTTGSRSEGGVGRSVPSSAETSVSNTPANSAAPGAAPPGRAAPASQSGPSSSGGTNDFTSNEGPREETIERAADRFANRSVTSEVGREPEPSPSNRTSTLTGSSTEVEAAPFPGILENALPEFFPPGLSPEGERESSAREFGVSDTNSGLAARTPSVTGGLARAGLAEPYPTASPGRVPVVRKVSPEPRMDGTSFGSLAEAVGPGGEYLVVELDFEGRKVESGFALAQLREGRGNKKIRHVEVRPAPGRRPVVVFKPTSAEAAQASGPGQILLGEGESLELIDLHLELQLPPATSALPRNWCLFESRGGERLILRNCTFTIRRDGGAPLQDGGEVCFLNVEGPADGLNGPTVRPPMLVELSQCVVRGDAALLKQSDPNGVDLSWKNGLFVSADTMFRWGATVSSVSSARIGKIRLEQVTAATGGILRMQRNYGTLPFLGLTFDAHGCVFRAPADQPWLQIHEISGNLSQLPAGLEWVSSQANVYLGTDIPLRYWKGNRSEDWTQQDWKSQFPSAMSDQFFTTDPWAQSLAGKRTSDLLPGALTLSGAAGLPVLSAEAQLAGCKLSGLPAVPGAG